MRSHKHKWVFLQVDHRTWGDDVDTYVCSICEKVRDKSDEEHDRACAELRNDVHEFNRRSVG